MYYLFAFRTRNWALHFCDLLKRQNISVQLINTPKSIGSGCGLSCRVSAGVFELTLKELKLCGTGVPLLGIYRLDEGGITSKIDW